MDKRSGIIRILFAFKHSGRGFQFLIKNESAFQQELVLTVLLVPLSFLINQTLTELLLLLLTLALVLIVEILNTAIETVVDRIGLEHHELSGLAKDLGSAAVLLALLLAAGVWLTFLWRYGSTLIGA
ncbi:diacylglycerol kinase [marine gamma proteobacterium HTCC2080]|jgi:diacylglycerol kinase (ATP)|nr:diacylglycerol kinase [marine gamma proteobacterium HTCC2080]